MTIEFIWQLPTSGDARLGDARRTRRGERDNADSAPFTDGVTDPRGTRFNYFDYLHQVARAADLTGFDGIKIQHDALGDESWIVSGYLARSTRHLKLITEFEASWGSAVYAAKNAVSFQRFTGGRQAWQISRGADAFTRKRHADPVAADDVLSRIGEFLAVARGVQREAHFDFKGRFFEVLDGGLRGPLAKHETQSIYLSGNDDAALVLSAAHATAHIFDAAPVEQIVRASSALEQHARAQGRTVAVGLRLDILARETQEEALADARRYFTQDGGKAADIHLTTIPVLFNGLTTLRNQAGATLIGSYSQIEQQLSDYAQAGVSSFILSAQPALEEAYRFGEHVLPGLRRRFSSNEKKAA